jgi:hypothetical protein
VREDEAHRLVELELGTIGSKSWPSAPRPCSQMTLACGFAPVLISTACMGFTIYCESNRYFLPDGRARRVDVRSAAADPHCRFRAGGRGEVNAGDFRYGESARVPGAYRFPTATS